MIHHIVMWSLKGSTESEKAVNIAKLRDAFDSIRGKIPGMTHMQIGVDSSRVEYACDVVLVSEFESQKALDAYALHPEHLRVKDELAGVRIARHQVDFSS